MSFVTDFLFGSGPEQVGTAQSPGDAWLQNQLKPLIERGVLSGTHGQGLYNVPNAPMPGYQVPQAPWMQGQQAQGGQMQSMGPGQLYSGGQNQASSGGKFVGQMQSMGPEQLYGGGGQNQMMQPAMQGQGYGAENFLQRGEVNAAQNIFQDLISQTGSARGGIPGGTYGSGERMAGDLATGAMGRYAAAQLPYDQMMNQQGMLGYTMGQIPQWQQQAQSMAAPWNMMGMYPGTTGSPMVQPGQQGLVQSIAPYAALMGIFG